MMENFDPNKMDYIIHDIMHFIPKSHMGLGVEENGAEGCRYHHTLYDNSGNRKEWRKSFRDYLKSKYVNWSEER